MFKQLVRFAPIIGAALIAQSVLWEFARMQPAYRRIVFPWSIRGTETTHGSVFVAVAVVLAVLALLVMWEKSQETPWRYAIVAACVLGPVAIALIFTGSEHSVTLGAVGTVAIGILIGVLAALVIRDMESESFPVLNTLWFSGIVMVVLGAIGAFAMLAITGGGDNALSPVALTALSFGVFGAYSLLRAPRALAANRMFIIAALMAGAVLTAQAGAIRATLLRLQSEFNGTAFGYELSNVAAEYKDSQITSGWFIGLLGSFIVLVASIAMWARRRDYILSQQRARKQREAAEKSAAEIREAIEQFRSQKASAAAAGAAADDDSGSDAG